jgi:hypothetical protein
LNSKKPKEPTKLTGYTLGYMELARSSKAITEKEENYSHMRLTVGICQGYIAC